MIMESRFPGSNQETLIENLKRQSHKALKILAASLILGIGTTKIEAQQNNGINRREWMSQFDSQTINIVSKDFIMLNGQRIHFVQNLTGIHLDVPGGGSGELTNTIIEASSGIGDINNKLSRFVSEDKKDTTWVFDELELKTDISRLEDEINGVIYPPEIGGRVGGDLVSPRAQLDRELGRVVARVYIIRAMKAAGEENTPEYTHLRNILRENIQELLTNFPGLELPQEFMKDINL